MTDLTAEKVRLVMLAIEALRLCGKIPPTAGVSTRRMSRISKDLGIPLDEKTFRNAERDQLTRVRLALAARSSAQS